MKDCVIALPGLSDGGAIPAHREDLPRRMNEQATVAPTTASAETKAMPACVR